MGHPRDNGVRRARQNGQLEISAELMENLGLRHPRPQTDY
jgi:hypothetical protein